MLQEGPVGIDDSVSDEGEEEKEDLEDEAESPQVVADSTDIKRCPVWNKVTGEKLIGAAAPLKKNIKRYQALLSIFVCHSVRCVSVITRQLTACHPHQTSSLLVFIQSRCLTHSLTVLSVSLILLSHRAVSLPKSVCLTTCCLSHYARLCCAPAGISRAIQIGGL